MKISVCMAVHNGSRFIEQQLNSILSQISDNDEIIIVDDCSEDNTTEIVEKLSNSKIKLFKNNYNIGVIKNFERSLYLATGDVIFLSDQDDIWLENKVQQMLQVLDVYDLVVSDCKIVDHNLRIIHSSFFNVRNSGPGLIKNLYKNTYIGCCMAFNRKIYDLILPFPENIPMHDWWIGTIAEIYGRVNFMNEKLLLYRRHSSNVSMSSEISHNSFLEKISLRLRLLKSLISFYLNKNHG